MKGMLEKGRVGRQWKESEENERMGKEGKTSERKGREGKGIKWKGKEESEMEERTVEGTEREKKERNGCKNTYIVSLSLILHAVVFIIFLSRIGLKHAALSHFEMPKLHAFYWEKFIKYIKIRRKIYNFFNILLDDIHID